MHCLNSQSKVRYKIFDMSVADVLVAEYQESIGPAIPQMITLLRSWKESDIFIAAANVLSKLSEHGKMSKFLT